MNTRVRGVDTQPFVSTGQLPPTSRVVQLVDEAYRLFGTDVEGEVSDVYPALTRVSPDLFGICVVSTTGGIHAAGEAGFEFSIMSVSKPFVFALVCDHVGVDEIHDLVGANATGRAFNSVAAVEFSPDGRTNPMVNSGAIATTSLAPGANVEDKWRRLREGLSSFAGRDLSLNEEVFESASQTNYRNQSIARLLESEHRIYMNPAEAVELYTRQCSLNVTARDLAAMGATLAGGGVNPITGKHVVSETACRHAMAVMITAGLYETSGDWLYDIGLPGKSGIGGGIVTVSPGKGGLGTFAPLLDEAGNSVKGQLVAKYLSQGLGFNLLASQPSR
jgi:glutaminase